MVHHVSIALLLKHHKDKCLSFPCAVRFETNSNWQMGRGHPVNSHSGQGDIKTSFTGQLITGRSSHLWTSCRVTLTMWWNQCILRGVSSAFMVIVDFLFDLLTGQLVLWWAQLVAGKMPSVPSTAHSHWPQTSVNTVGPGHPEVRCTRMRQLAKCSDKVVDRAPNIYSLCRAERVELC